MVMVSSHISRRIGINRLSLLHGRRIFCKGLDNHVVYTELNFFLPKTIIWYQSAPLLSTNAPP